MVSRLQERVYRSSTLSPSPSMSSVTSRCPSYRNYDNDQLMRAYEAVKDGCSIRSAAEKFGVPRSTLSDHVSGKVQNGRHSGPERYLSDEEEKELVRFICKAARMGYAKTRKEVMSIVEKVLSYKGRRVTLSNGWWVSFKQRYPSITLRTVEKLSYCRLIATDECVMSRYFDLLEETLQENDLLEKPSQIFNCDETGLCLDHNPSKVVGIKGQKHPRAVTSGRKKQITVLACANAAGNCLPPLVIFGWKAMNPSLTVDEVPSTMYGLSSKGWMDSEIFLNWFLHHFLLHAPSVRPLLLLLDGHSTHYNPSFIQRAAEEKVIVFCFPPNTTHLTQPLDKGIFGPLKTYWNQECLRFMSENPGRIVTEYDFNPLFSKAWYKAMSISNIMAAFKTTGIYPFNRNSINVIDDIPDNRSLAERTGLAFIPLYSPARSKQPVSDLSSIHTPISFTSDEVTRFIRRYEEGYDITDDERYNLWLKQHEQQQHSPDPSPSHSSDKESTVAGSNILIGKVSNQPRSTLRKVLTYPEHHTSSKATESKSARVLTSLENRMALAEKERQKKEKEELKERRKLEREQKKAEKQVATKQKKKNTKCVRDELDLDVSCHIFDFSGNRSEGSQLYLSDNEAVDENTSIHVHSSITSEIGISGSSTTKGGSSSRALSKKSSSSRVARRKNSYNNSCKPSCTSRRITRSCRTTDTSACDSSALNNKPSGYSTRGSKTTNASNSSVLSKPSGCSKRGGKTNTILSKPSGYSTRGSKTTNASNLSVLNKPGSTRGGKTTNASNSSVTSRCNSLSSLSDTDNVDEKGYCFCGGKDEGQMVYCENKNCRNGQWFHFKCVQMKTAPRGLWFCSNTCNQEFQCH
ncbi:PREDICTED: uncharacterized protein LOC109582507 isoform X4 [Amphimedon queenslandica]|uniref:HTH CENPB-type domain-containing protein n=1 Tax=Amphimedon queenslandica TaxID=400682 RepID=A0AAN0J7S8_AMPQE|nr:PREDICTED: uncharacterized protein LOC109582507 isoform X4 [Amphimedon queenslandica]|eukprot:XP_019852802.1 PREDICTED: uncharacterized protein LOC109582507 isoform X4 [Amphimedon queenslandica]